MLFKEQKDSMIIWERICGLWEEICQWFVELMSDLMGNNLVESVCIHHKNWSASRAHRDNKGGEVMTVKTTFATYTCQGLHMAVNKSHCFKSKCDSVYCVWLYNSFMCSAAWIFISLRTGWCDVMHLDHKEVMDVRKTLTLCWDKEGCKHLVRH